LILFAKGIATVALIMSVAVLAIAASRKLFPDNSSTGR
jgi:hypothetical protein